MSLFQSHYFIAHTSFVCPNETVVQIRLPIIEEFCGSARTMTSAIPGVNAASGQGSAAGWFAAYTDSRQGAEFLFDFRGHREGLLPQRTGPTNHSSNNKLVVLPQFFEGILIL